MKQIEPIGLDWLCLYYIFRKIALTPVARESQGTYFYHSVYFYRFRKRRMFVTLARIMAFLTWLKTTSFKFTGLSKPNRFRLLIHKTVVLIKSCVEQYSVKVRARRG